MQPRTSIYHKLILYVFFLGIFVIIAVSLFSFIAARNAILQRTYEQLTSLRVAKKEQVEQFFADRIKEVELFSSQANPDFFRLNTKHLEGFFTLNLTESGKDANFKKYFKSGGYYKKVYFLNDNHFQCYDFDSLTSEPKLVKITDYQVLGQIRTKVEKAKKVIVQDFFFSLADSSVHMFIASPVASEQQSFSGFIVFEIRPSAINNIMRSNQVINGLGKSGEVYLVGPDSLMRSESRFFEKSILRTPVNTESVRKAYKISEGTHLKKDYRGIPTLSSYSRLSITGLDWVIIAEMDKKEAMKPVYKLANEIVFLSIFITLILFIISYIISRTITRPIIDLKDATIRVQKGDLDPVLHIKSNDELGELTENFNLMISQLKANQSELRIKESKMYTSFLDGQEDERQRLSRELHDGLGQMIVATKLKVETMVNKGSGIDSDNIYRLRLMFDNLVDEVRGISNNLMPLVLQEFGLELALKQLCKEIEKHSNIKVVFDSQVSNPQIDKRITTYVFRIAQEALNNAVKHANASEIYIALIGNEKVINLMVQDDGIGINPENNTNQNGRGLNSMRERVKLLNGIMDISKGENNGTIVSVKIPLYNSADATD
ncbi:MAG: HAMP domain-containing protein [Bacteroidota bacterium]